MSELFKSKLGWSLAGIHLLMVFSCLLYITLFNNPQNVIAIIILMILTAPWGLLFMFLPGMFGIATPEILSNKNLDLLFTIELAIGGLINAFILYFLGLGLAKAYRYLSSNK